jgi:serine/threonine protein phosphatase 1
VTLARDSLITYAIGDVHGCRDKLIRLLYFCARHRNDRPARFVFLGDYIDRGPDSRGVIEILINMQRDTRGQVICLRGNHEALLLNAMGWQRDEGLLWVAQGGARTLLSYGVKQPAELPAKHLDLIRSLPLFFDDGRRLFVHAGVNPLLPLDQQVETDLLWIREPFLSSDRDYGRLIVHGHTPLRSRIPELRPNRLNLDTAAVYGGPLTAAVFDNESTPPIGFITDGEGDVGPKPRLSI